MNLFLTSKSFRIQLAVNTTIPEKFGGVEGESIYIDTEGSFVAARASEIATGLVTHLNNATSSESNNITTDKILSQIHYFRVHGDVQLLALAHHLKEFVKDRNIKSVIIDSIAFPFRLKARDQNSRMRHLSRISQCLIDVAVKVSMVI